MNENNSPFRSYFPIVCAICVLFGLLLGRFLYEDSASSTLFSFSEKSGKVDEVINEVVAKYVDPVDQKELTEYAIKKLLENLDPHSSYIPPQDVSSEKERMQGKFDGIGIEFRIIQDTLMVVSTIVDGPSEKAGLLAGDRIIGVDEKEVPLGTLSSDSLVKVLRGKSGSVVTLMIYRPVQKSTVNIPVIRGEIPIYSIDVAAMLTDVVGYVKINRFSYQTQYEFKEAVKTLKAKGAKQLIVDVKDNPGGSLGAVIDVCDQLLPEGRNIVYTKGENEEDSYNSMRSGEFMNMDVAVLVNRNSASASEILAGALQDNDKAIVVGRRTFGKGLVQDVITLNDKSRLHLTIARYFTPSGRCIQKPFEKNKVYDYRHEELERWENGELYHRDSIKVNDSLVYKTMNGRLVYGGGGVIPDVFVPYDTTQNSDLLFAILGKNLMGNFAVQMFTSEMIVSSDYEEANKQLNLVEVMPKFKAYVEANDVQWNAEEYATSEQYIQNQLAAFLLRVRFGNYGFWRKIAEQDADVNAALIALKQLPN